MPESSSASRVSRTRTLQRLALGSYLSLILLTLLWEGWLAPAAKAPPGFWVMIKGLPLLLPLRGMLQGRPRSYLWACLLLLPYFMEGVMLLYLQRAAAFAIHSVLPWALLETLLTLAFIVCASFYVRRIRAA